ncbi:hypothetical protein EDC18_102425 [Natranaerovirga pectinivora]|uniref:Uncharacterized protein n=1 Tax=Natranaerovirga pectinivora TaxID=682400 RepID=A0A4R3MR42_9FIRM|nr:hypothetical protein [Natranaerovirga pectinivora]TCT16406.1 hypothetical protein EDC18_102425 [Natranaerovirga pectinivora]
MMKNIVFVSKEIGIPFNEIMEMPYAVFLSYLKHLRIFQLEQTEDGRKALQQAELNQQTEPDWNRIRSEKGYAKVHK